MQIAVCIPNPQTAGLLPQLFDSYQSQRGAQIGCRFFEDDTALLENFLPGEYDALLFGSKAGDVLAREIRARDGRIQLIRVVPTGTSAIEDGMGLWYCLPEPLNALFLFPVLDRLSEELRQESEAKLLIKTKGRVIYLAFSQIEYVEVIGRAVRFHMTGGNIEEIPGSFSQYEERILQWPDFVKVHRAYLINLRHIEKLMPDSILTRSGHCVPVSQLMYPKFKRDYLCGLGVTSVKPAEPEPQRPPEKEVAYTVLFVDDEEQERTRWAEMLSGYGCAVYTAGDFATALQLVEEQRFDCLLLDVRLRQASGFDLCEALQEKTDAPVIFLSALGDAEHQEQGFLKGGVDYITKDTPAALVWLKLETRIKMARAANPGCSSGSLYLDFRARCAFLRGKPLMLTSVEFDLLSALMQHPGTVFDSDKLYQMIWGAKQRDDGHTVQLHLSLLCNKLETAYSEHSFIDGVWGTGYRFVPESYSN